MRRILAVATTGALVAVTLFGCEPSGASGDGGPEADASGDADQGPERDAAPDTNADELVERVAPEPGSTARRNAVVEVVFLEEIRPETLLLELAGVPVRLSSLDRRSFRFVPLPLLEPESLFEVRVLAGLEDVTSAVLDGDLVWSFATEAGRVEVDGDPAWSSEEVAHVVAGEVDEPMELVQDWRDPESALYEISPPVEPLAEETQHLVARMMRSVVYHGGIGLAAPQVGIGRRLFVADVGQGFEAFLNPELTSRSEELDDMVEGCLSVPGERLNVFRPRWIELSYDREDGTRVEGRILENPEGNPFSFPARVWLHEYDHLNGVLLTQRASAPLP